MDVKALYPSMSWKEILESVNCMMNNTCMNVEKVDCFELGKFLAVMMTTEEIAEKGLENVIPKRRGLRLRKITVNYSRQNKNADKWLPPRRPCIRQKKIMLALAVKTAMSCHTYKVADDIYQQLAGASIDLELTGAVVQVG